MSLFVLRRENIMIILKRKALRNLLRAFGLGWITGLVVGPQYRWLSQILISLLVLVIGYLSLDHEAKHTETSQHCNEQK